MAIDKRTGYEYADGTIREHLRALEFVVHLDDGRDVTAGLPKSRLRQIGCLIGSVVGWRATIAFRPAPKVPAILELRPAKDSNHGIG